MTTSGIGEYLNYVGYGFSIGCAKEVCPTMEFHCSGKFELLLNVFVGLNAKVSLGLADEWEVVIDEDASERFLSFYDLLAEVFREDFEVNFDGPVFDGFTGVFINEENFSKITVGFLCNVEGFEGDAGTVVSFQACGHVPAVYQKVPLGLRQVIALFFLEFKWGELFLFIKPYQRCVG
jgi:hypothetical protein